MFCNCWRNYYLRTLTSRTKWTKSKINLSKNDLVIVKSKDVPRLHWSLGRILDTYPGSDGVVRSVKIKTPSGDLIRPIRSSCVLEKFCD